MNKNSFNLWTPISPIPKEVQVEAIYDDWEGFRILLRCDDGVNSKMLRILFENNLSYSNTDESFLLRRWGQMPESIVGNIFYLIKDSSYIEFFTKQSAGLYEKWDIKHYAIYTISDCIDILSMTEPKIEWL